jgi:putative ABC transport system permease protein
MPKIPGGADAKVYGRAGAIRNAFLIAAGTLWGHKLRSVLTVFGIVIGITAVVLIGTTLGALRETAARSTAQTIGADTFIIAQVASVGNLSRKKLSEKLRKNPKIYRREAEALAARISDVAIAAPTLEETADVKRGNKTFLAAGITGSTANLQAIRNINLSSGRFFTEAENRRSMRLAVVGQAVVDEISPASDPIGKEIRIKGQLFRIIGVQEKQGSSFGSSLDRRVYIPLLAFEKIWGSRRSVSVTVQPLQPESLVENKEQSRFTMRLLRRLKPRSPDNFDLLIPEAGTDFLSRVVGIVSVAIIPITSVALIVAGIVVMNIMLVSVTERTLETGIRKSLGARNRDIFAEILFESTILTLLGGMAGLLLSYLGALGLSHAFGSGIRISPTYVALALGIAAAVGISAGLFPAYLASRMPPVEALRYEN